MEAANDTGAAANQIHGAINELSDRADAMAKEIETFLQLPWPVKRLLSLVFCFFLGIVTAWYNPQITFALGCVLCDTLRHSPRVDDTNSSAVPLIRLTEKLLAVCAPIG